MDDDKIQISLRMPPDLHTKLKEIAKKRGVPVTSIVIELIWQYVEEKEK